MTRRRAVLWLVGIVVLGSIAAVALVHRNAAPLPQMVVLKKGDFLIFGGNYADQTRNGFRPRADTAPIRLKLPLKWDMDPLADRNWRFQLQAWRMLNPIWSQWYDKDWQRLVAEIMPWVHDWYVYYVVQDHHDTFEWYDMAAGYRAQHLAMLLHLHNEQRISLDPEQLREVSALARLHVAKLRDADYISKGNHGIIQLQGLRLLCLTWRGDECRGEQAYSARLMHRLLHAQFGEQGVQTENSPSYHLFALKKFSAIRPALYPSMAADLKRTLETARAVAPWFTLPDGSIAAMGDSAGGGMRFGKRWKPTCTSYTAARDCIISNDLTAGGYAVVRTAPDVPRTRASMLIVGGASVEPGTHDHADELGFVLFSRGRRLFVDAGKYSYNVDRWRDYFLSNRAHNVAGAEGYSWGPRETLTHGSALTGMAVHDAEYIIDGRVERRGGLVQQRRFHYLPGRFLDVSDTLTVPAGANPVVYWHLAPGLGATITGAGVDIRQGQGMPLARMVLRRGTCTPRIIEGHDGNEIQGWVSPTYLKRVPAAVIEYRCAADVSHVEVRVELGKMPAARPDASRE